MERERSSGRPLLLFDTGGVFLKRLEDAGNAPLVELTAGAMVEGLGVIGYDALNLGRADLLLPSALLRRLAAGASFPVLSANVVDAAGKSPFPRWIVKESGGVRVGVFGLSGDQPIGLPAASGQALAVRDPAAAAREAVAALRRTCDLVVALSQLGLEADARLAREVEGVDVILGGFTRQTTQVPRVEGATLILQSGAKGMQLGRLELQIRRGQQGAWTPRAAARGGEHRVYDWKLVPLDTAIPDHPTLAALLDRHRGELRARNLLEIAAAPPPGPVAPVPLKPAYVGAAACGACHREQLRQWQSSGHARAMDALRRKRQDLNPECVRCHVTAYGEVGGFRPAPGAQVDLGNVQCEACHGFGREHRGPGKIRGRVPEAICRRCHTTENSPTFKYEPYLKRLGNHAERYFTRKHGPPRAAPQR